ncbi:hypothetical protein [Hungatella hathewayi]|uniref:hypothetical protein n=1 Tax=Hungatella hathewayi TaxID=154046 RepID=UPI00356B1EEF
MGLIRKLFKKKEVSSRQEPELHSNHVIMGFVLLKTPEIEEGKLTEAIKSTFGDLISLEISREKLFSVIVHREDLSFICTLMPFAVPDQEVESQVPYNSLTPEGEKALTGHQAFLVVAGKDIDIRRKRESCLFFNRLCGVFMRMEEAAGMYMGGAGLLIEKEIYLKHVEIIESPVSENQEYFPAPLWIRVLLYMDQERKMARTSGLTDFGHPDVCIYNTHQEPEILYQQLYLMAMEEITGKSIYRSGDQIWTSDGTEAVCKLNDGVLYIIGT